jgi:hypothetical protein
VRGLGLFFLFAIRHVDFRNAGKTNLWIVSIDGGEAAQVSDRVAMPLFSHPTENRSLAGITMNRLAHRDIVPHLFPLKTVNSCD